MAFKMKGNPYKMGKMATKSAMEMKTSYKMKEAMAKMKSPMELKKEDSSMKKYKSDAQRKAVHASKAEKGMTMKKEEAMKMKKEAPMKAAKPDYIDLDGDGNKTESMKKAAADKKSGAKMKKKEPMKMKKEAMKMKKDPAMKIKFDDNPKEYVKVPSTGEMVKPNTRKNITEVIKIVKKGGGSTKQLEKKRRKLADKEGPAKKA